MSTRAFDFFTRQAAAVSRRASLATLGGAALATTLAKPDVSKAKKGGQSCGKKQKKKCNNNETQCIATGTAQCNSQGGDPAQCLAIINLCCQECFSNDFLVCLLAQSA